MAVVEEVNRGLEAARSQHRVLLQQMTTWTSDESFESMRAACVFVLYCDVTQLVHRCELEPTQTILQFFGT